MHVSAIKVKYWDFIYFIIRLPSFNILSWTFRLFPRGFFCWPEWIFLVVRDAPSHKPRKQLEQFAQELHFWSKAFRHTKHVREWVDLKYIGDQFMNRHNFLFFLYYIVWPLKVCTGFLKHPCLQQSHVIFLQPFNSSFILETIWCLCVWSNYSMS